MKEASRFRALASLCRQHAAYNPADSWKLLAQAEHWEHLATQQMSSHFKEWNADRPVPSDESEASPNVNVSQWKAIAAA